MQKVSSYKNTNRSLFINTLFPNNITKLKYILIKIYKNYYLNLVSSNNNLLKVIQ